MTVNRPTELPIDTCSLPLPVYFPSISSVKTALGLQEYSQVLSSVAGVNNQFLISAFDLANIAQQEEARNILGESRQKGIIVLMDSGNYESFWKNAQPIWTQAHFHEVLQMFPCDLSFSFDEQNPPNNFNEHIELIVDHWTRDQAIAKNCQVIPIIHASSNDLPALCATVATRTDVPILAVPERKLGDGILERIQTVQAIRAELNKLRRYVVLHLLGTGNPISITLFSVAGADSFDGLEWCQTVVDSETALLYHFSQADFFMDQSYCGNTKLSFQARTLIHNLEFFSDWMEKLRSAITNNQISDFCHSNLPHRVLQCCTSIDLDGLNHDHCNY